LEILPPGFCLFVLDKGILDPFQADRRVEFIDLTGQLRARDRSTANIT
jgi:hypothetical protein